MKRRRALLLLIAAAPALAQTAYRWVDDKGRVQYSDQPPPAAVPQYDQRNLSANQSGSLQQSFATRQAAGKYPVTLYVSKDCGKACEDVLSRLATMLAMSEEELERARNQLTVRALRSAEQPFRRVEEACLDLLFLGRVRPRAQSLARLRRVSGSRVAEGFAAMLQTPVAAAATGRLPRQALDRIASILQR